MTCSLRFRGCPDYFFKDAEDGLGLSPAEAQALITVTGMPWNIKPFYGLLSDAVPLFGTRRKGWLMVNGALGAAGKNVLVLSRQRFIVRAAADRAPTS